MAARLVAGTANPALAGAVAAALGTKVVGGAVEKFPDGELRPALDGVRGDDVYVLQPTGPPVSDHFVELLLLLDACRRSGADRVTAVVPYFGYARQDRRSRAGEAVGARVVIDALAGAGAHRLVVVDPHTAALEARSAVPGEMLTAVPVLAGAVASSLAGPAVLVAPDLGAVKLAERFAAAARCPVAVVRKRRLSGTEVRAEELVGDVSGRAVIVVDDMISTGGTIKAAVDVLVANGALPDVTVLATHGLFVGDAADRFAASPVHRVVVTDTVPPGPRPGLPLEVTSVAPLLADAVGRLHRDQPLDDLLART